jgi:anti-sigma factor RsiW
MPHLDEGLLNALLDNELDEAETSAAKAHLASCPDCRRQYEEARAMAIEADRLVALVEVPEDRKTAGGGKARGGATGSSWARWRTMAWAATVALAAGLGWLASDLRYADRRSAEGDVLGSFRTDTSTLAESAIGPAAPAPEPKKEEGRLLQQRRIPERFDRPAATPPVASGAIAMDTLKDRDATAVAPAPAALQDARKEAGKLNAVEAQPAPSADMAAAEAPAPLGGLSRSAATKGFRQLEMEDAVRTLAGSIRLVDGLAPLRFLSGPGSSIPGGDPSQSMIRVVYEDPPGRELWLDQQRPGSEFEQGLGARARVLLRGDTVVTAQAGGLNRVRWIDQHGFRLALTGYLPADSLRAIIPRVQ